MCIRDRSYFDIASDLDIGKVDPNYLFDILTQKDLSSSDALFVSCTALPVLSSNQTLIWDTLNQINYKNKIEGYGELFNN